MKKFKTFTRNTLAFSAIALLVGCAATQTAMEHHSLDVSTRQSETIFLDPVADSQKTIFIAVKNTSDQELNIAPKLKTALSSHGYKVVNSPSAAHYLLQANILTVGKMSVAASQTALGGGYGSALAGGVVGAAAGSLTNRGSAMVAGGLIGGVVGLAADSLVKDVNYTMVTDVQISERAGRGIKVREHFNASLQNGSASNTNQSSSKQGDSQRYLLEPENRITCAGIILQMNHHYFENGFG